MCPSWLQQKERHTHLKLRKFNKCLIQEKNNLLVEKYWLTKIGISFYWWIDLYNHHSIWHRVLSPPLLLTNILTCPCIYILLSLLFHSTHIYWLFTLHLLVLLSRTWDKEMSLSFCPQVAHNLFLLILTFALYNFST